jgi:hypothetical protein
MSLPIAPAALSHIVSSGMAGWLCDLSITRISDIANAQLSPGQLDYFCLDATFFSQLCQRRDSHFVFCYPAVCDRFTDWLEDRHPLNRSLLCIPSNTSGSHWNGSFIFLDERIILHVDSTKHSTLQASNRVITVLSQWLRHETAMLLARPYNSPTFQERLHGLQDLAAWRYGCRDTPTQSNGNDCGVFYIMNLVYTLQNRMPNFSQIHMPLFRQQLFTAIMHNSLPPLQSPLATCDTPFAIPATRLFPLTTLPLFNFIHFRSLPSNVSPPVHSSQPFCTIAIPEPLSPPTSPPLLSHHAPEGILNYPDLYPS